MGYYWIVNNIPTIKLSDVCLRNFDQSVSVLDITFDIGLGLIKATFGGKVNGGLFDAFFIN